MSIINAVLSKTVDGEVKHIYPKTSADTIEYNGYVDVYKTIENLKNTKVDKSTEGILSSNDLNNELYDKLLSIEDHANKYILLPTNDVLLGGAKIGYERNGSKFPVKIDNEGNAYLEILTDNPAYEDATEDSNGLFSIEDKDKIDGIEENANNYILKPATRNTIGGVKTAYTKTDNKFPIKTDSKGNAHVNVPYAEMQTSDLLEDATTEKPGFMTPEDKRKLDTVMNNATKYVLPVTSSDTLGGFKTGFIDDNENRNYGVKLDANSNPYVCIPWVAMKYEEASNTYDGLMSIEDKSKLDALVVHEVGFPNNGDDLYNAARHNCYYRGRDLTEVYTDKQLHEKIDNGSFEDLFIGDYFTRNVNGIDTNFVFAGFDIFYNPYNSYYSVNAHHAVMVMMNCFEYKEEMDDKEIISGYYNTKLFDNMNNHEWFLDCVFDQNLYMLDFVHEVSTSLTGRTRVSKAAMLLTEKMIYGTNALSGVGNNSGLESQLPLFRLEPRSIMARLGDTGNFTSYWLQDIRQGANEYCAVRKSGRRDSLIPTKKAGVRVWFILN